MRLSPAGAGVIQRQGGHHQIPGITTPQPRAVTANRAGSATQTVNGVRIVFQPDNRSQSRALTRHAKTRFRIHHVIRPRARRGRITRFTGPGTRILIRTTYGPQATSASPSHYGRGTTAADRTAGNTSLGFHEGNHGLDIVEYVRNNALPAFGGRVGMTIRRFQAAHNAFNGALRTYRANLCAFTVRRTECVGTSIDTFNRRQGVATTCCSGNPQQCC